MIISGKTKLLVISPHPDDEALGIGGLIGKCKKEGAEVSVLYICVGSSRQYTTKTTNENTRLQEIKNVEKFAKIKTTIAYIGAEFCRLDIVPQKDLIEKIEDSIADIKPTIVGIPSSASYNQDHRAVYDACITALRPLPKDLRHLVPTVLEYFEPYIWAARPHPQPNAYLNLAEKYKKGTLLDFKINLYKCHATQVRKDPFPRSPENVERLAHIYGKEIGVETAEAYHLLRTEL